MLLIQYFHQEEALIVGDFVFKATCKVRNEINDKRKKDQVVETWPSSGFRAPYYPRRFPTGVWMLLDPIWTDDPDYAPVKIPTTARRNVLIWNTLLGEYVHTSDNFQEDSFYHLHYAKNSPTTLGCIRLNSADDAVKIAKIIETFQREGHKTYIEVFCNKG